MHSILQPMPQLTTHNTANAATMTAPNLDYDILNNMDYLDDVNYDDFVLYPTSDADIRMGDDLVSRFFPEFDFNPQSSHSPTPCSPASRTSNQMYHCTDCSESFRRPCDLNRHRLKHDTPFKCVQEGCGMAFSEKRRCKQHEKRRHGLVTEHDFKKCSLCDYNSIRPDAVRRHMKLKHGVHVSFRSKESPASNSSNSSSNSSTVSPRSSEP
ncbi:hypothetical protein PV08_07299 [Exophiala spinifera]|uniref:C2H2-type domain-containing protein n=1 Tax=Exophiala spinifera TaxID=91928 RepID=A0A0D2B794_9EURO|nr:uncharacterized protein PV08_07299 [Exophiala spinifera]KIW14515.1 hypothetical protein PV08_07299 [Exophiala spinifera]